MPAGRMCAICSIRSTCSRIPRNLCCAIMFEAPERDPRIRVRRPGAPDPDGRCVVYWMQRAQRAADNPALDVAIEAANALGKPVVVFFGLHAYIERANLRHYRFLVDGLP